MSRSNAPTFFGRIRPWQWIKHSIFTQYLVVWAMKVGSPPQAKTIWVIDAFAGAGEFVDQVTGEKSEGSPMKAALVGKTYNARADKRAAGKQLRLICIERDPEHYEALKERMSGFDFAEVLPGEFGEHADEIIKKIGRDRARILLDPIGVKSIDAATCRKLLHRPGKTDAFVNVQFAVVHRTRGQLLPDGEPDPAVQGAAANVRNIDAFFGNREAAREVAEAELRAAAGRDIGDWFSFEVGPARPVADGAAGTRLPVTAYIGTTVWASFRADLVGPDVRMTGEPEPVPPLARVAARRAHPRRRACGRRAVPRSAARRERGRPVGLGPEALDVMIERVRRLSERTPRTPANPAGSADARTW